jgi:hypothetical protein
MTTTSPLPCTWNGTGFDVLPRFARQADQQYVIGETYRLANIEDRSDATHKHEFAWIRSAWLSLPEEIADDYATPEHLRKRALIATGFFDETRIDVGTTAGALKVAAYARGEDGFAHVVTRGPLVVIRKARSQSRREMDKAEFQASKTSILEWISDLLGVEPTTLERQAA